MKWASSLKYLHIDFGMQVAAVKDMTERVSFRNNLNGEQIRLHFSNRYGRSVLRLDRVTIGTVRNNTVTDRSLVKKDGESVITLLPGQEFFSDAVPFHAAAGERLAVCIYTGEEQRIGSICSLSGTADTQVCFGTGDQTDGQAFTGTAPEYGHPLFREIGLMPYYGFDAVQVYTGDEVRVIAAFGDSITHMSFVTDALAGRLYAAYPGKVTLLNCGISGNRLVHDATRDQATGEVMTAFGEAGVRRFERDVFGIDDTDTVLSLIGINDIMHPVQLEGQAAATPPEELIEGYNAIAAIAHAHGARIFGATVMPCGNEAYPAGWLPAFEKTRLPLNEWLRGENALDGYFDYDAAMRDEARPGFLLPGTDIGDGLHPNGHGGAICAGAVDLDRIMRA